MSAKEKKITTLADLMEMGKKNGKLTSKDIGSFLENMDFDMDQVDKFYESLETAGIDVIDLGEEEEEVLTESNIEKFEKFMDTVKVLLMDDIHLIAINEQNRAHISSLLNRFRQQGKQIVITSRNNRRSTFCFSTLK